MLQESEPKGYPLPYSYTYRSFIPPVAVLLIIGPHAEPVFHAHFLMVDAANARPVVTDGWGIHSSHHPNNNPKFIHHSGYHMSRSTINDSLSSMAQAPTGTPAGLNGSSQPLAAGVV